MGKIEVSGAVTSPESLGRILQQSRLAARLTQRELAEQLDISQRYVWEMETGKPSLYTDRLFAYMRATGMRLTATIDIDEALLHGWPRRRPPRDPHRLPPQPTAHLRLSFERRRGDALWSRLARLFEIGGFLGALFTGWGSDKFFKGNRTQMNIIYVVGIIVVALALWFVPSDSSLLMSTLFFLMGFFIFGPQFLIAMAAAENSHKYASGASTGFVSLFAYIGAAVAGLPLSLVIEHYKWNGFFGTLFMISLACALLLILVYILQRKRNKNA